LASNGLFSNIDNLNGRNVKSINAQIKNKLGASGPWWQELDLAGKTRVVSGNFTNLSPTDNSIREPIYVDNLATGQTIPASWKPTLNPKYEVISGKVGSLAKDATGLINPSMPNVLEKPANDALIVPKFNWL